MKKVIVLLSFISCLSITALQDAESKLNNTSSGSSSTTTQEASGGYYKKNTQVVASNSEFDRRKFNAEDFGPWLNLYYISHAVDTYYSLIEKKLITKQGFVLSGFNVADAFFNKGDIVRINTIASIYSRNFTGNTLVTLLKSENVLDVEGFVVDSDKFASNFETNNFKTLEEKLKRIDLNLEDTKASAIINSDLYRYILNESKVLVIDKLESTDYQSKKSGFLDSFADSLAGNFVGKLFNPDKITTTKSRAQWSPLFNPYSYYNIYYGFNSFPYENSNSGLIGIFGNKQLSQASFLIKTQGNIIQNALDINTRVAFPVAGNESVSYAKIGLKYDEFRDVNSMGFYNLYVGAGGAASAFAMDMGVGLVYRRGISTNGIGFSWQGAGEWYVMNPLYVLFSAKGYAQPNFLENKNTWDYYEYMLALGANIESFVFEYGYQWNKIQDGWYGAVKLYF